ncbi:hypothetical protein L484_009149 [Morus notabilis]|uniref:Uncharacterized protein n=1 Tax=Morus notabilis TaxID=981085 RepID=W9R5Q8_9ROSA|nr:hypothetical protein L484_009149 [Morus notabilis]
MAALSCPRAVVQKPQPPQERHSQSHLYRCSIIIIIIIMIITNSNGSTTPLSDHFLRKRL